MFMVSVYGPALTDEGRALLQAYQPGSLILFNSNAGTPRAVTELTDAAQQTVVDSGGLPMLVAVDQEGGLIARLKDGFTEWPVPMLITATGDTGIAYRVGQAMAEELRAVGVNMNLAPVADLYTNVYNPVIGRRSFGSDPDLTGRILAAVVQGMQDGGVMATAKHFPGHGDTSTDSHVTLPIVPYDRARLDSIELAPFRWTMAAGVGTIMVAHIWFPALDSRENFPASLSPNVVSGLLRGEMGYQGLIMTDALEMDAIDTVYSYGDAAIMAIQAGNDLVSFGAHVSEAQQAAAIQAVIDAVQAGVISEARIDESFQRILAAKERFGVLDWQSLDPQAAPEHMNLEAHAALVDELFRAGTTIVYDYIDAVPLSANKAVAMIYPANRPRIAQECGAFDPAIQWVAVSDSPTSDEIAWAVDAAQRADVAVVFTQNAFSDTNQQTLVLSLPPEKAAAVSLVTPFDWLTFPNVGAYLATYSALDPGITAVCAILFGAAPARGQLPVALSADLPAGAHGD